MIIMEENEVPTIVSIFFHKAPIKNWRKMIIVMGVEKKQSLKLKISKKI